MGCRPGAAAPVVAAAPGGQSSGRIRRAWARASEDSYEYIECAEGRAGHQRWRRGRHHPDNLGGATLAWRRQLHGDGYMDGAGRPRGRRRVSHASSRAQRNAVADPRRRLPARQRPRATRSRREAAAAAARAAVCGGHAHCGRLLCVRAGRRWLRGGARAAPGSRHVASVVGRAHQTDGNDERAAAAQGVEEHDCGGPPRPGSGRLARD